MLRGGTDWVKALCGAVCLSAPVLASAAPPLLPAKPRVPASRIKPPATESAPENGPIIRPKPKASATKGPYEAVVREEDVTVRCGPGRKYYPTSKLRAGTRVKVVRHDPGGWFVIEPPEGSFSWVPARAIDKVAEGQGVVVVSQVGVRVGSYESDIRDIESRPLRKGESVRILGEKNLAEADGRRELWYKIAPPKYEWRWVLGQFVVPVDQLPSTELQTASAEIAKVRVPPPPPSSDPFVEGVSERDFLAESGELDTGGVVFAAGETAPYDATPEETHARRLDRVGNPLPRMPLELDTGDVDSLESLDMAIPDPPVPGSAELAAIPPVPGEGTLTEEVVEAELRRLDAKLRTIVEDECVLWEFTGVRAEYEGLLAESPPEEPAEQIRARLAQIRQWERKRDDVLEFRRLALIVERRDRELAEKFQQQTARAMSHAAADATKTDTAKSDTTKTVKTQEGKGPKSTLPEEPDNVYPKIRPASAESLAMGYDDVRDRVETRPPEREVPSLPATRTAPSLLNRADRTASSPSLPVTPVPAEKESADSVPTGSEPPETVPVSREAPVPVEQASPKLRENASVPTGTMSVAARPETPIDGRTLFVGAGLIEVAPAERPAGAPAFRLITPQGRFLAWLRPAPAFEMARWVGKPAGLLGRRQFDTRLQADVIDVNGASPVRLASGPPTQLVPPAQLVPPSR